VVTIIGCGGGTTGTSPTNELKFSGLVQQSNGTPAPSLLMTVRSGLTNDNLLYSGTNEQGEFAMDLPADEESLVIDVQGVGSTTVTRAQRGAGIITAKLQVMPEGGLSTSQLSEAQIDEAVLCSSLAVSGNMLNIVGDVGQEPCLVVISIASQKLGVAEFEGVLSAVCDNTRVDLEAARASQQGQGQIALDLNRAFSRGCEEVKLSVLHSKVPELVASFIVE
jgi:hypothetical protein